MMPDPDYAINGLLCYLSSARHLLTEHVLLSVCQSFYCVDKVNEAKRLLYSYTKETPIIRRGDNRVKSDLNDIILLLRKLDEDDFKLPKFLCDNYTSMPPVSGYEVIAAHIIELLSEIQCLKNEVSLLKASNKSTKIESLTDIKEDIFDIKSMLIQKNTSETASGSTDYFAKKVTRDAVGRARSKPGELHVTLPPDDKCISNGNAKKGNLQLDPVVNDNAQEQSRNVNLNFQSSLYSRSVLQGSDNQYKKDIDKSVICEKSDASQPWQMVNRRKNRNIIKGIRKFDNGLKGARVTSDVYMLEDVTAL